VDHRISGATHPTEGADPIEDTRSNARITVIVQNRLVIEASAATGMQVKHLAQIPQGFALYRRTRGGNEPILDDDIVDVRNGDHFFARPSD
jgi:hypothetical protein